MRKIFIWLLCLLGIAVCLWGCGDDPDSGKIVGSNGGTGLSPVGTTTPDEDSEELGKVYILKSVNQDAKEIVLIKVGGSYREYTYKYTGGTVMENRYGTNVGVSALESGEVYEIETNEANDTLKAIRESAKVWTFDGVKKFSLDMDKGILKIGGENYRLSDTTIVMAEGELLNRYELSEMDTLYLVGYEKDLLSIVVENRHGILKFVNTEKLEKGYFVLGNALAGEILANMTVEAPAGEYSLSVANNGIGGRISVTIRSGEITEVDLSQFEAAEAKYSQVSIELAQEGTVVRINGEIVDTTQSFSLKYGLYRITADLDGYDTWSRLLMVSSPEAKFLIDFGNGTSGSEEDEDDEDDEDTDEDDEDDSDEDDEDEIIDNLTGTLIDEVLDSILGGSD